MSQHLINALKVGFERQCKTSMVSEDVIDVIGPIDLDQLADHLIHSCGMHITWWFNGKETDPDE